MKTILLWKIVKKSQRKCFIIYVFEHDFFHGCSTCYDKALNFLDLVLVYKRKLKKKKKSKTFRHGHFLRQKKQMPIKITIFIQIIWNLVCLSVSWGRVELKKNFPRNQPLYGVPLQGAPIFFSKFTCFEGYIFCQPLSTYHLYKRLHQNLLYT